jgi:hypothetical protein
MLPLATTDFDYDNYVPYRNLMTVFTCLTHVIVIDSIVGAVAVLYCVALVTAKYVTTRRDDHLCPVRHGYV